MGRPIGSVNRAVIAIPPVLPAWEMRGMTGTRCKASRTSWNE
jgi:hypothetical protein